MTFDLAQARSLLLRGASVGSIAKKFRMTTAALYWRLADEGMAVADLKAARKASIVLDLAAGKTIEETMEKFGCSRSYAENARRENLRVDA